MSTPTVTLDKTLLERSLKWFQSEFQRQLVSPINSHFPDYPLPSDIRGVQSTTVEITKQLRGWPKSAMTPTEVGNLITNTAWSPLLKQIVLHYRRHRAAHVESMTERTIHLEMIDTLEQDVRQLDALVREEWFQRIMLLRLPRLKDFLPVQLVEAATQLQLSPREYDQKFPILQAPNLFLPDLAYFRAKCEDREALLAVAYLDIDHFKQFNTDHSETKVDRNLLPVFMQAIEAHVYHHGYGYHEGGDEFMLIVPSLSRPLAVEFFDELRIKLAALQYPDIPGQTTISLGLCVVESGCPLTDRELRERANRAKKFAKDHGRNRVATYNGPRFIPGELAVVRPQQQ